MFSLIDPEIVKKKLLEGYNLKDIVSDNIKQIKNIGLFIDYDEVVLGRFINLLQKML